MKVKMKLGELQSVIVSLQAVKAKKLPIRVQYALAVNIKTLTEKYVAYNTQRTEILEKDCVKDTDGHPVLKDRVTKMPPVKWLIHSRNTPTTMMMTGKRH